MTDILPFTLPGDPGLVPPVEEIARFAAHRCEVRPVAHKIARQVVAEAHYLRKLGPAAVILGMYTSECIAGVMTFGTIPGNNAASVCGPEHSASVMELTRLALYDWAPRNSESWFIGQSLAWLTANRPDVKILLSYADPSAGHVGTIYQATNWMYTGQSTGDVVWHCDDGRVLHPRTTGWDTSKLPPGQFKPAPGKHRYVRFQGSRSQCRRLQMQLRWPELPYPKTASPGRHKQEGVA